MQPPFDLAVVEETLAGTCFGGPLHHLPTASSTNALALAAAQAGERGGVWVADEQTAGRGRGGHTWHSPAGDGLYVSVLAVPKIPSRNALHLSLATGLAVQTAIAEAANLQADIRWPNDLLLAGRKCGGILVETATEPVADRQTFARVRYAVIGIGINVGHTEFPTDLEGMATSLRIEANRVVRRDVVLVALLRALDTEVRALARETAIDRAGEASSHDVLPSLLERFAAASSWVRGKRVTMEDRYTGTTAGLTPEGFLQVAGDDGVVRTVRSGGVRPAS